MKTKIKNKEVQEIISGEPVDFPKYTTQLMNLANQNAQGTRASVGSSTLNVGFLK